MLQSRWGYLSRILKSESGCICGLENRNSFKSDGKPKSTCARLDLPEDMLVKARRSNLRSNLPGALFKTFTDMRRRQQRERHLHRSSIRLRCVYPNVFEEKTLLRKRLSALSSYDHANVPKCAENISYDM